MTTCKSITVFVQISSHENKKHEKVADNLTALYVDGTVKQYPPDAWNDIIKDAMGYQFDLTSEDCFATPAVPIIATYDMRYCMALSWPTVCAMHRIVPTAKSPSDIYNLKLYDGKTLDAIVFDMRHIMTRGIRGTGQLVGIEADGTAETDCMIMARYYQKLMKQYQLSDKEQGDRLGSTVMTLTGLARHEVKRELAPLSYTRRHKGGQIDRKLGKDYSLDAARDAAKDYGQYAMRRACMRGGLSFIAPPAAGKVWGRTIAIDETSAYHAQVMCRYIPEEWAPRSQAWLQAAAERVASKTPAAVLRSMHMPFVQYFHMQVEFTNLRLKPGTVFEELEIGIAGTARLYETSGVTGIDNEAAVEAERGIRANGYGDTIEGGRYAFSKIMSADRFVTWVTEQELWCMAQAYTWDTMTALEGEGATKRKRPDDLSILTSMHFWKEKQDLKNRILEERDEWKRTYLDAIYRSEVKPKFNAIGYGLHARDEYRPGWRIDKEGAWELEEAITPENFEEKAPARPKAWIVYGMRIAGGARMQLILAMQLIWEKLGNRAIIIAGDTDSLKLATDCSTAEIMKVLEPLHQATRDAIARVTARAWSLFGRYCCDMEGLGEFQVEGVFQNFYATNVKQYCSIDKNGRLELTCAGVPNSGQDCYAAWLRQMVERYGEGILPRVFTWGVTLDPSVSQLKAVDYNDIDNNILPKVTGTSYTLGEPIHDTEAAMTIQWQREHGRAVSVDGIAIATWRQDGPAFVYQDGEL